MTPWLWRLLSFCVACDILPLRHAVRYYEPLAHQHSSLDDLLSGPAVRKLLFMADPSVVDGLLKPHWGAALQGQAAEVLQAVPNMLEVRNRPLTVHC
jgi:hypothetical protein